MNLGVVTLNLPRIGLESDGDISKFWRIFRERMQIIKEALSYRYERVKQASPKNAPILYKSGAWTKKLSDNDKVDELFTDENASLSIGYIGIYETVSCIYGKHWEENDEAKEFSVEILRRMKKYADKWTKEQNIYYSVYGTPKLSLGAWLVIINEKLA